MPTISEELQWLAQADRARRLAATLPPVDARLLESFAAECEAKAHLTVPLAAQPARRAA